MATELDVLAGIGPAKKAKLKGLGLETLEQLVRKLQRKLRKTCITVCFADRNRRRKACQDARESGQNDRFADAQGRGGGVPQPTRHRRISDARGRIEIQSQCQSQEGSLAVSLSCPCPRINSSSSGQQTKTHRTGGRGIVLSRVYC